MPTAPAVFNPTTYYGWTIYKGPSGFYARAITDLGYAADGSPLRIVDTSPQTNYPTQAAVKAWITSQGVNIAALSASVLQQRKQDIADGQARAVAMGAAQPQALQTATTTYPTAPMPTGMVPISYPPSTVPQPMMQPQSFTDLARSAVQSDASTQVTSAPVKTGRNWGIVAAAAIGGVILLTVFLRRR